MSQTKPPFELRINSTFRYYEFASKTIDFTWEELLFEIDRNPNYGIPEILVLLNPKFYAELKSPDPRGERTFTSARAINNCRAKDVWGYECPFTDSVIHVDHVFPHSKGGATDPQNAMYLCSEHNSSKHTDIHLIPWEQFPDQNNWITRSVNQLLKFAQRYSTSKLYLPKRQISKL